MLLKLVQLLLLLHQVPLEQLLLLLLLHQLKLLLLLLQLELLVLLQIAHAILWRFLLGFLRVLPLLTLLPHQLELLGLQSGGERAAADVVRWLVSLRIGQRRRIDLLLQELFLQPRILVRARLPLLLLQAPDLLLLKRMKLQLRVRRAGQREQDADNDQPLEHSGAPRRDDSVLTVVMPAAIIKPLRLRRSS